MIPAVAAAELARFCDVFCENFVFNAAESTRILEAGKKHGLVPTIHADEIESSGGAEVAARVGAASASHLLQPSDAGLRAMAQAGVVAVLLPGTCFFLREAHKSPVARMRELGIVMALATDFNPGSCTMLAQPLTAQFGCIHYGMTMDEALRGVTVNAARALKLDSEVGTLEPGKAADIVVTDVPDYRHIIYRLGHNPVSMTIRVGRVSTASSSGRARAAAPRAFSAFRRSIARPICQPSVEHSTATHSPVNAAGIVVNPSGSFSIAVLEEVELAVHRHAED